MGPVIVPRILLWADALSCPALLRLYYHTQERKLQKAGTKMASTGLAQTFELQLS